MTTSARSPRDLSASCVERLGSRVIGVRSEVLAIGFEIRRSIMNGIPVDLKRIR
jgi:hypothetical protein